MRLLIYIPILIILFSCSSAKKNDIELLTFNNVELLMSKKAFFSTYDSMSKEDTYYKVINHYSFKYVANYFTLNGNQCIRSIVPKFRNDFLSELEISFFPEKEAFPFFIEEISRGIITVQKWKDVNGYDLPIEKYVFNELQEKYGTQSIDSSSDNQIIKIWINKGVKIRLVETGLSKIDKNLQIQYSIAPDYYLAHKEAIEKIFLSGNTF